jgi:hypothetical protein
MIHDVNNYYMNPEVANISNGYNPIEDTQKNYPVYFTGGVMLGSLAQEGLGKVAGKALGALDKGTDMVELSRRILWSGGENTLEKAADFAVKYGYKTLEKTTAGELLNACQKIANKLVGKEKAYKMLSSLWDKASAQFVIGADGTVLAFLNSQGISDTSVFMRIEYELAKEHGINLVFHLV